MAHTCHAVECNTRVVPEMLMCRKHWFMVPMHIRRWVWSAYRDGQCDDQSPSADYCNAAQAAVIFVAEKEGKPTDGPAVRLYDFYRPNE